MKKTMTYIIVDEDGTSVNFNEKKNRKTIKYFKKNNKTEMLSKKTMVVYL